MPQSEFSEWALGRARRYLCGLASPTEEEIDDSAEMLLKKFPSTADIKGILIGLVVETVVESSPGFDIEEVSLSLLR
jgi:hypothetical protein